MRIGIDISQIIYEGTGVADYTKNLVENLIETDTDNDYVLFGYSAGGLPVLEKFRRKYTGNKKVSIKLFPLPHLAFELLWNNLHMIDPIKLFGHMDLIHSSDWIQPPSKAKKVTTVHDLVVYKYPDFSHPRIISVHKQRLNYVKKECDMVISDSKSTKNDLINILKFDSNKIEVVYPGIDSLYYPRDEEKVRSIKIKYKIPGKYILSVGTAEPRKNLKNTINAFNMFKAKQVKINKEEDTKLVIAGNQGWGISVKNTSDIINLGFIPAEDLPILYSGALMFVYPSYYEGFGLPVVEAMACGCPVVTTNRGSLEEIAQDCAIIVDPDNPHAISEGMYELSADSEERKKIIKKAGEKIKQYNWKKSAMKILKIYNKITKEL